jgi:hypothetical protein
MYAYDSLDCRGGSDPRVTDAVSSGSASITVASQDSEHGFYSLTYQSPNNAYTLAHVFMLAYPYGVPTILSSYTFNNGDDGAPNGSM